MKHWQCRSLMLACLVFMIGTESNAQQTRDLGAGCFLITQKCKATIKQTKWGFKFGGIDFGAGKKVGSVELGTELIQQLTAVAQILDQMQLARCQILNSLRTCDSAREKILVVHAVATEQLGQLALLSQMYSGNADKLGAALLAWIVRSTEAVDRIYKNQFLAAGGSSADHLKIASSAQDYALKELKVSHGSAEFKKLLESPSSASLR